MKSYVAAFVAAGLALSASPLPAHAQEAPALSGLDGDGCIAASAVQSTKVIDDYTVALLLADGTTLTGKMAEECFQLAHNGRFRFAAGATRICPGDPITVVQKNGLDAMECALGALAR